MNPREQIAAQLAGSALGKPSALAGNIEAGLLYPLQRAPNRELIGIAPEQRLPFLGADLWTAYELSWLTPRGKPQVAIAHLTVPCESPHMVESKSLKLYFNSFAQTPFAELAEVRSRINQDLSAACGAHVGVRLVCVDEFASQRIEEPAGTPLDRLDLDIDAAARPDAAMLSADVSQAPVQEVLTSHLLKSNCPVTNQPDWGSVEIRYSGAQIDHAGLLRYIVAFRSHQDFHEHCCERLFLDIWQRCQPSRLSVYLRYTRRGGIDINPFRCSHPQALPANVRHARQ